RTLRSRRHPDARVELCIAGFNEGMRPFQVNWLTGQHMSGFCVVSCECVMRQVALEIEGRDLIEQTEVVEILVDAERRDLTIRACGTESILIDHRYIERLHQRASVLSKALLTRYELVTMVLVLHLALLQIGAESNVVVRRQQQARSFAL